MPINIQVPPLGESVKQAILVKWHKADGDAVALDEAVCELETDKANVDVPAPVAGVLRRLKNEGDTLNVGETIAVVSEGTPVKAPDKATTGAVSSAAVPPASVSPIKLPGDDVPSPAQASDAPTASSSPERRSEVPAEDLSPAVRAMVAEHDVDVTQITPTGPGGRVTKEDVQNFLSSSSSKPAPAQTSAPVPMPAPAPVKPAPPASVKATLAPTPKPAPAGLTFDDNGIHRAPLSKIRKRIAENLLRAQSTAAILTTFNEVDMSGIMELRSKHKDAFEKAHGVGLGFMSFFAKAVVMGLREFPRVNAFIEGDDVVYHQHVHLGIAVSTERGLAVPVLKHIEDMSFAKIEAEIKRVAAAVKDGKLGLDELSGGTFTVTNGGVFGSLLSTPILNPPQSGILGMHTIQKRPVVITKAGKDEIEIRPMMYVALSYDHRIVDGRESVSFLVRLKQLLEDPARLMLEI